MHGSAFQEVEISLAERFQGASFTIAPASLCSAAAAAGGALIQLVGHLLGWKAENDDMPVSATIARVIKAVPGNAGIAIEAARPTASPPQDLEFLHASAKGGGSTRTDDIGARLGQSQNPPPTDPSVHGAEELYDWPDKAR